MLKLSLRRGLALALIGGLATAGLATADDRTPDKILADIKGVEMPKVPANRSDQAAVQAYFVQAQKAMEKKAVLIGELYKVAPDRDELVKLMPQRWQSQMMMPGQADAAKAEIDEVIARSKNPKLVAEACFQNVVKVFREGGQSPDPSKINSAVDAFIARFPKDDRGAMMLSSLAQMTDDEAKKDAILKRMEKDYPNSPAVKAAAGTRRQKEAVGKPFEIAFVDAIKGGQLSSETLKGKVVVVDFWATWCGPCVAEMPKMKDLYAKYKDQGVEFVGVSLDSPKEDGGLRQAQGVRREEQDRMAAVLPGQRAGRATSPGSWGHQQHPRRLRSSTPTASSPPSRPAASSRR